MDLAFTISLILALGIAAQWLGWFLKQPAIIFLLAAGIIFGPVLGLIDPDAIMGDWLFPFISLGVAVILFEGAMTLEFHEIKNHGKVVTRLITTGVLITIAIASATVFMLFDMSWEIAILFGTLVCVTGPTVIVPMLRSIRPNSTISNILRWEGILVDPIGALMVILIYTYIATGTEKDPLIIFSLTLGIGLVIGFIAALALVFIIKRHLVPEYLKNVVTLALVLLAYAGSNNLVHESGLVTVTAMGIVLANWPRFPKEEILHFKESLSVILISVLFIILAARIDLANFATMGYKGLIVLLVLMIIARPLTVWMSARGSILSKAEKHMISWIAPRGIIAAAVSSLFIIKLEKYQLAGTELLVPLVFTTIIGTVVIQSLGASFIAEKLGVRQPHNNGVMIAGGRAVALNIGKSLADNGFSVLIASPSFDDIKKARMQGLKTYYGNVVSEHADRHLQLVGVGCLFAMAASGESNILSTLKYRHEFGDNNIYRLKNKEPEAMSTKQKTSAHWQTQWLFGSDVSYSSLNDIIASGGEVRTTMLTHDFSFDDYQEHSKQYQHCIPLYAISPKGELSIFSTENTPPCESGWRVAALVLDTHKGIHHESSSS